MGTSNGFNKNKAMKLLALAVIFPSSILIILYILQQAPMQKIIKKGRQNDCTTISTSQSSKINSDKLDFIMSSFLEPESQRVHKLMELDFEGLNKSDAKKIALQILGFPLQSVCVILKRIGGRWMDGPRLNKQVDGDKFICLDNLVYSRVNQPCIIYSFGVSSDWSFEDHMDRLGCQIFAHDHTIDAPAHRGKNIKFFKTGLGKDSAQMKPLNMLLKENNHSHTPIEFLKIDIEGGEFKNGGFNDWFSTGVLVNVNQIALELHLTGKEQKLYVYLLKILRELTGMGFRLISQEVNMVVGPDGSGYYNNIEVVFMKKSLPFSVDDDQ